MKKTDNEHEIIGKGANKEEYRKSVLEAQKQYKDQQEKDAKQKNERKRALESKLKFYKGFVKNKDAILNIREYQEQLEAKLDKLESQKKEAQKIIKEQAQSEKKLQQIEKELKDILKRKSEIEAELKDPSKSDKDKEKLKGEESKLNDKLSKNQQAYLDSTKQKLKENKSIDLKKMNTEILKTKIQISKCNIIWSNLLKGKEWNEVEAILKKATFKDKDGKLKEVIRITKDKKIKDKEQDKEESKEQEEKQETKIEGEKEQKQDKKLDEIEKEMGKEVEEILDSEKEESKDNLPIEVKTFAQRHPRLAKIPFLAKIVDGYEEKMRKSAEKKAETEKDKEDKIDKEDKEDKKQEEKKDTQTKQEKTNNEFDEKSLSYIDKQMKAREGEMFKSIAEKGFKESIKYDVSERLAKQKVEAANRYAEKYGSRYKEQDGAEKE